MGLLGSLWGTKSIFCAAANTSAGVMASIAIQTIKPTTYFFPLLSPDTI
jgi:hypothetical protein